MRLWPAWGPREASASRFGEPRCGSWRRGCKPSPQTIESVVEAQCSSDLWLPANLADLRLKTRGAITVPGAGTNTRLPLGDLQWGRAGPVFKRQRGGARRSHRFRFLAVFTESRLASARSSRSEAVTVAVGFSGLKPSIRLACSAGVLACEFPGRLAPRSVSFVGRDAARTRRRGRLRYITR